MVFMSDEQRKRYTTKPGLSELAQTKGWNAFSWEDKQNWDLKYIEKITFLCNLKLVLVTVKTAFIYAEGITNGENMTALDCGDIFLKSGKVNLEIYN